MGLLFDMSVLVSVNESAHTEPESSNDTMHKVCLLVMYFMKNPNNV